MVSTCVNITYIYTLGADVSEITERGTLVGQGNKVQCTHPFTVASLSRFLSYPPTANVSLSVTFPSFFVYRYRLFFPFSRTGTATAVASDSVSNGSGGHTILRLNSTDTAAQLRSFSSYSFFFLFLSLSLILFRHHSFFLLPFFPSAHVHLISLFHSFSFSMPDASSFSFILFLSSLYSIRPLSGPIRDDRCFVFHREHSGHTHTYYGIHCAPRLKSRDRKIRLRKTVDFLPRERVTCRRKEYERNGQALGRCDEGHGIYSTTKGFANTHE